MSSLVTLIQWLPWVVSFFYHRETHAERLERRLARVELELQGMRSRDDPWVVLSSEERSPGPPAAPQLRVPDEVVER